MGAVDAARGRRRHPPGDVSPAGMRGYMVTQRVNANVGRRLNRAPHGYRHAPTVRWRRRAAPGRHYAGGRDAARISAAHSGGLFLGAAPRAGTGGAGQVNRVAGGLGLSAAVLGKPVLRSRLYLHS